MAETLVFDVLAKASGANDVKKLGQALDDVGKSADKLDGKSSGGFLSGLTDKAKSAAAGVSSAFGKVAVDLQKHGKQGGDGFGAGLIGGFTGVFGKIGSLAAEGGATAAKGLSSGLSSGMQAIGPAAPVLFGALIGAAPMIGATLAAGIIAGVGAAGIGGAIALQMQDPDVLAAATGLGDNILTNLRNATAGFKPLLIEAFSGFGEAFRQSLPDVQTFFKNLESSVLPLATSLGNAARSLISGFSDISGAAQPVLMALGEGVEQFAAAISQGFSSLQDNGAAAATALQGFFFLLSSAVAGLFAAVNGLTEAFGFLAESGILGPGVAGSYERWKAVIEQTKASMTGLKTETESTTQSILAQQNQMKAAYDPAFALITAQDGLKKAQTEYNSAVKQFGVNSAEAQTAAANLGKASIQMGDAAVKAGESYNGTLTPAMRANMQAAGLSAQEINAVEKSMQQAAQAGQAYSKDYKANITLQGLGGVQAAAGAAKAAIDAIPSTKTITINAVGSGLAVRRWGGIDKQMAAGGVVQAHVATSPTVLYGERATGEEAFVPKNGNAARSKEILDRAAEWYGGRVSWPGERAGGAAPASRSGGSGGAGSDRAIVAELRALGDRISRMSVTLDGRRVGAVQGREMDLYERAG